MNTKFFTTILAHPQAMVLGPQRRLRLLGPSSPLLAGIACNKARLRRLHDLVEVIGINTAIETSLVHQGVADIYIYIYYVLYYVCM